MRIPWTRAATLLAGLILCASTAFAQAGGGSGSGSGPAEDAAPPPVSLDSLLKLPTGAAKNPQESIGGVTRKGWQERFAAGRADLAAARARLANAQQELEAMAAGVESWQVSAPGGGATTETGPLSFAKREEIRQGREDVAAAEKALDELRIEASLAGVPEAWTEPPEPPADPTGAGAGP